VRIVKTRIRCSFIFKILCLNEELFLKEAAGAALVGGAVVGVEVAPRDRPRT
jgi:hypothetical protein